MDSRPIVDKNTGETAPSPGARGGPVPGQKAAPEKSSGVRFPGEDGGRSLADMAQRDLTATLQLLAERAQYITGATGAAIALRDQDEMVCRAKAGSSAPDVGVQLQVNSGLSGESVRTRQTLRCDDAFTDPRVNRAGCEALGIRSVVVMPLIRGEEVIGVFELFSDKANIFETRDLVALERMGTMVHTALEHSTAALGLPRMLGEVIQPARPAQISATLPAPPRERAGTPSFETARPAAQPKDPSPPSDTPVSAARSGIAFHGKTSGAAGSIPANASAVNFNGSRPAPNSGSAASPVPVEEDDILEAEIPAPMPAASREVHAIPRRISFESLVAGADPEPILSDVGAAQARSVSELEMSPQVERPAAWDTSEVEEPSAPLNVPRIAVANLRKCQECGFPVSEGRQLCLDCEKKLARDGTAARATAAMPAVSEVGGPAGVQNATVAPPVPSFMGGADDQESWLSTHKFMVIAVALAAIGVVAVVLLR
jgi:putative methionine-R-sulfoxide reductase with GAF domain